MAAVPPPQAGGFVLWLHGSGGSGDESRAEVAPYFAAPELASSVRLSFPTAPTAPIACYGALAIASVLLYPKTLGGCVVFSGSVPLRKSFADKTPVLWFHGMADGLVLFEAGHAGCAFLEELGMTCEFKAYPTLGHSVVDEELQYFQQWILNHLGIRGATETAMPSSSSQQKDLQ
ncbi:putative carboxylesterase [Dichanthelium oligosanthes]|uniref:Putative carboxylesterase n=1 Tax=Dichanthelium oligosanthes TaxID=888268 RepID=A0A1E5WAF0_9POAL|nr:putative carboxylesterase [Dichanthelium oligosanthes]